MVLEEKQEQIIYFIAVLIKVKDLPSWAKLEWKNIGILYKEILNYSDTFKW